jgi:hypothetical protein
MAEYLVEEVEKVDAGVFSLALSHCAREAGASKDKRVLLVLDRAGFHTGGEVMVSDRIKLEFLPARQSCSLPRDYGLWSKSG